MTDFQHLLNESPALFLAVDREGIILDARGAWRETLGYEPEALRGTSMAMLIHPEELASAWDAVEIAHQTGQPTRQYEVRNLHRNGSVRWISWTSPAPRDGISFGVGVDVTERRAAKQQLEEARGTLRSVLETVPFYVLRTSREGIIEYINRTYPGVTTDQIVGTHLLNWLPPDHREPMRAAIARIVAGAESTEFLGEGSGAHGPAWYRSRLGPIVKDGVVVGVTVVGEDITEAKVAEERHIQTSRLETAGRVAGGIAHDFNNLLMIMSASLSVIELDLSPEQEQVLLQIESLHRTIDSAAAMTRGLLDTVRTPTLNPGGRIDLRESILSLKQVLAIALGSGITLQFNLGAEAVHVQLAEFELQQILVNLAVNCREAMGPQGTVQVGVRRTALTDAMSWLAAGNYVELVVKDDGPGMTPAMLERALEPFATTKVEGTGFGLATCQALARARGGEVKLHCPPEGGTEVTVRLPLLEPVPEEGRGEERTPSSQENAALTILLVDDNDGLRVQVARYLTRMGLMVLEARDGADALTVFDRHPKAVDAVVTDYLMPGMNGLELARALRDRNLTLPIRVLSGASDARLMKALEPLSLTFTNKPVRPHDLLELLIADTAQARALA